ncbi:MAG TPA: site-specific integrase [Nevskiaceae bacterium]|nr:site-specific integrase [Nevskiaceae bacterium]
MDSIPTFEEAAQRRWAEIKDGFRNAKHRQDWISSLERHVFPTIGAVRVDRLKPKDFADALRQCWKASPDTARRVKQRCHGVMAACYALGLTAANPVDVVGLLMSPQPAIERHQPAMPWQTVPEFVQAKLTRQPVLGARAALLFAILTCARSGEVRGAVWSEIDTDAKLWTIPEERMKAHREHRVPLSDAALRLLAMQPRSQALVFPAIRGGELSDMALSSLLRKAHAPSDVTGRTATAHGFRSSFRNWAADHGYDEALAERALAHTIRNKVQAAYERTDRLAARVEMMQAWADHVMGGEHANVVALRTGVTA